MTTSSRTTPTTTAARRTAPRRRLLACALPLVLALTASCTSAGHQEKSATAGAPGVGDPLFPGLGNGGYHVRHYGLTLDYEPDGNRLKGKAVITARSTQPLSAFNLDLKGLKVRSASVDGKAARTARAGAELTVTPETAVGKDREFTTTVVYDGVPETIEGADGSKEGWIETSDGAVGLGEPSGSMTWFPGNHHPSDKAAYDIAVTVPKGLTAVSNGELKRKETKGDRTTFAWHNGEPMAGYLATVAVGDFDVATSKSGDTSVYVATDPKEAETEDDDSIDVPGTVDEVLDWERGLFGPYPFSSAGAIVDHLPGLDYALETQTKPYFDSAPDESLVVHELAHQWFGNSVTPRTWRDMWLNESFATYAEWMWEEKSGGRSTDQIFSDFYDGTDDESDGIWAFPPADPPSGAEVSDSPVYGRGAMVLHKVRKAVGDKVFFATVRAWVKDHRHGNADTAQFIRHCEEQSGKDLGGVFDTWLRAKGKPSSADA
ncbi:M1 family metallopeptidase [Streptomyces sp. NPDC050610]|uniref:M1 family metallopeptidase n=1 Tax=Streptomyces sp. NPDC050610 TaxID=3157097 RepID=UPI00341C636F